MLSLRSMVLLGALPALFCQPLQAERIVLKNGVEIRGFVVGNEQGAYLVRIGSYTKRVQEGQVKSIVDDGAQPPAAAPMPPTAGGADASAPLSALLGQLGGAGGGQAGGLDLQKLLGGLGGGNAGAGGLDLGKLLGGGGAGSAGGPDLQKLLGGLGGGSAGGLDLNKLLAGAGGGAGGASLPLGGGIGALAEKMRDPGFQQSFLTQIEQANKSGANPGAATPYIGMLKGLFQQLNKMPPPGK